MTAASRRERLLPGGRTRLTWTAMATASLLLASCGGGSPTTSAPPPSETVTSTPPPAPPDETEATTDAETTTATPAPPDEECSALTGQEAVDRWLGDMETHKRSGVEWRWSANVDATTYDPCAGLSWVSLNIERGTGSSPHAIMLFHQGEFVGPATDLDIWQRHEVRRISEDSIEVTYSYPDDDEFVVDASGRATSTFTWDEAEGKVVRTGELPPAAESAEADAGSTEDSETEVAPGAFAGAGGPRPADAQPMSMIDAYGQAVAVIITPSGNIGCEFSSGGAGCGVISWIEAQPFGAGGPGGTPWWVNLGDGSAVPQVGPKGDAPHFMTPGTPAVSYGEVVYHGAWTCASEEAGLTCWNTDTGHGAFMNRSGFTGF